MGKEIKLPDIPEEEQTPLVKGLLETGKDQAEQKERAQGKRPGSQKKLKTAQLQIHEDKVIGPCEEVPAGSRFKGYRDFVVQDLVIRAHNVRYRLERWETPDGRTLRGRLPAALEGHHFGPHCAATSSINIITARSRSRCCWSSCANGASISPRARSTRC